MNAEDPRTVCVEVVEAFLRSTLRLSGDRGGGLGGISDDREDLVGDVDSAKDDRDWEDFTDGFVV